MHKYTIELGCSKGKAYRRPLSDTMYVLSYVTKYFWWLFYDVFLLLFKQTILIDKCMIHIFRLIIFYKFCQPCFCYFQVLVFAERKQDVDAIHEYLLLKGVEAVAIHGGKGKQK